MILYVSDLDGTLLNSYERLSSKTINTINGLIEEGLQFSIATARSYDSAEKIIESLNLKLPLIVHNGVFIFDPVNKVNILSNYIEKDIAYEVLKAFEEMGISPVIFTSDENHNKRVYYKGIFNEGEAFYIKGRLAAKDRRFTLTDDFSKCFEQNIINFLAIGEDHILEPVSQILKSRFDLTCHYMMDIYSKAYWLELSHKNANKRDSVKHLKELLGAEKLVCFGDNLNDLPMFEAADEGCAVVNSHEMLKSIATRIIEGNNEDGVAKYLKREALF